MALSTQDFTTIVRNIVTAIQASSSALVDLTIGSVLRSFIEANAAVTLWLQGLIIKLLSATRAATSSDADLDTWVNDYGVTRLVAVAATGQVTFARFTTTNQAIIAVGTLLQTSDGTQIFTVIADTNQSAYNLSQNAYLIAVSVASAVVSVRANTAGTGGNVVIGALNTLTSAIPYVDTVTNAAAFINGANAESDAALRTRFVTYIASLSKATKTAVGNAILSIQQGLTYTLTENLNYDGSTNIGYFYVVVDDGTGSPSGGLLASVGNAVEAVRPVGSTFGVFAPVIVTANVTMTITTAAGYTHGDVVTLVTTAITNYINTLSLGSSLTYTRLSQIAYDASPGVTNVTSVTLNSGTSDVSATAKQVIKAGTVSIA